MNSLPPDSDLTAVNDPIQTRLLAARSNAGPLADRYLLGDVLARGGMGEVYDARDTLLNRRVAIKVIQTRFANSDSIQRRFLDEAAIASQIQHPGVPPVHDIGTLPDQRPFLVMKLIKGSTLADLLKSRASPDEDQPRYVQIFEQICQTLAYTHSRNVIHRDLKPLNVMVGAFGEVQVMDWGVAKVLTDGVAPSTGAASSAQPVASVIETTRDPDSATQAGSVVGTWGYMPPEQARGEVDRMNRGSDVFSLGGILCEILTGSPTYTGTVADIRAKAELGLVDDALARLDASGAEPEIVSLAKHCLMKDASARPADAAAVADVVSRFRAGMEDRLHTAERDQAVFAARAVEQRRKRRVQLALAGALGLLLFGSGAFAWWNEKKENERQLERGSLKAYEDRTNFEIEKGKQTDRIVQERNRQTIDFLLGRVRQALLDENEESAELALSEAEARARQNESSADVLVAALQRHREDLEMLAAFDDMLNERWRILSSARNRSSQVLSRDTMKRFLERRNEDILERVRKSEIRELLLQVLESGDVRHLALLNELDPDPFRVRVRTSLMQNDDETSAACPAVANLSPNLRISFSRWSRESRTSTAASTCCNRLSIITQTVFTLQCNLLGAATNHWCGTESRLHCVRNPRLRGRTG